MRKLLVFVFLLAACGNEEEDDRLPPETGIFDVVSTLVEVGCPESTLLDFTGQAIEIYQRRSKYFIALYDDEAKQRGLDMAESDNGYDFIGGTPIDSDWLGLGCSTSITWAIVLDYLGGGFTGMIINRMSMSGCPEAGSCLEKWSVEGVKR